MSKRECQICKKVLGEVGDYVRWHGNEPICDNCLLTLIIPEEQENYENQIKQLKAENVRLKEDRKKDAACVEFCKQTALEFKQQLAEKDAEIEKYKKFFARWQFTDEEFTLEKIDSLEKQIKEKDANIKSLLENELEKTKRLFAANTHHLCEKIREWADEYTSETTDGLIPQFRLQEFLDQLENNTEGENAN